MEPFSPLEPKAAAETGSSVPEKKFRVLVGVTGSVAALKLPLLISELLKIPGTCVIRAWDLRKPLLFCPAMNTAMWEHPITAQQVEQLKAFGYMEIPCVVKKLVCGDEGRGAMAEVWTIAESVRRVVAERDLPAQS
uniref:Phosphopantothenoylcysteine decarboxylase n=1 Tax=Anas platyrhynchos platyrhynchos TaxID=8840 RepID=A0A493T3E1_ANAPP